MNCEITQLGPLYSLDPSQQQREAEEEVREVKSRKGLTPLTGFEDEERGPRHVGGLQKLERQGNVPHPEPTYREEGSPAEARF